MVLIPTMRTRLIIQVLSFALIVAAVVVWMKSRATALEFAKRGVRLVLVLWQLLCG